jgi:DUF4097 and DUF4098 domain-containing protein YvlB
MKKLFTLICLTVFLGLGSTEASIQEVYKSTKSFKKPESVQIEGDFCKVVLKPSDGDSIKVETIIEASQKADGFDLKDELVNNTLQLSVIIPDEHISTKSGRIVVNTPEGMHITVKTSSGYIESGNLKDCTVNAHASYGKISAENISGEYDFRTSTGAVSVMNVKGNISVNTKSGNIDISNIDGYVTTISDKGDISVNNIKGELTTQTNTAAQKIANIDGKLMLRTSTGELTLKNIEGHLQTLNDDGDVWIENLKGTMDLKSIAGRLTGTGILLTGNTYFETTKGRIEMELKNSLNELTFDLESNYGFLYIPGEAKKKKLKSGNGPIVITGRTNNGPQRFTLKE